ncbi:FUT1 [Cordylochernes scorpioides]|uniref:L-Fucosyltransferase n=1 Tax=Cordylochernes scorpioides TaxID=51811 RepID=A0ABY6K154_9ARAC|nr:FUT1 [Cordylochernes scorpioides]
MTIKNKFIVHNTINVPPYRQHHFMAKAILFNYRKQPGSYLWGRANYPLQQKPSRNQMEINATLLGLAHFNHRRKGRQVDMEYFNLAMKYFEDRYEKVVFVVMSDDRKWRKENFANNSNAVLAPPVSEPAVDMALIFRCHHHIMSYRSFGFWGAYPRGGTTLCA